jgi:hypothetical protein
MSRVKGHALSMTWSGEYGEESTSTGTCKCNDWEESGSSQEVVREEYRHHLKRMREQRDEPAEPEPRIPFRLGDYSPNTNMIMGALLSGGDPLKMAQILVDGQEKKRDS